MNRKVTPAAKAAPETIIEMNQQCRDEMIRLVADAAEHARNNGFTFLMVAGRDGVCSRYMGGLPGELRNILLGLAEDTPAFKKVVANILMDLTEKDLKDEPKL